MINSMEKQELGDLDKLPRMSGSSKRPPNAAEIPITSRLVEVQAGPVMLAGILQIPGGARGLVMFVHGSGSSRFSPRNQRVAGKLQQAGLGTLLFDLLTPEEEELDLQTRHLRFNISLLARRAIGAVDWLRQQPLTTNLRLGFFGASTGAAAAIIAAAERPEAAGALVLRDARPDLAAIALPRLRAPVLLIAGSNDERLCEINNHALGMINPQVEKALVIVPGAGMLVEETGAAAKIERLALHWFVKQLQPPSK